MERHGWTSSRAAASRARYSSISASIHAILPLPSRTRCGNRNSRSRRHRCEREKLIPRATSPSRFTNFMGALGSWFGLAPRSQAFGSKCEAGTNALVSVKIVSSLLASGGTSDRAAGRTCSKADAIDGEATSRSKIKQMCHQTKQMRLQIKQIDHLTRAARSRDDLDRCM